MGTRGLLPALLSEHSHSPSTSPASREPDVSCAGASQRSPHCQLGPGHLLSNQQTESPWYDGSAQASFVRTLQRPPMSLHLKPKSSKGLCAVTPADLLLTPEFVSSGSLARSPHPLAAPLAASTTFLCTYRLPRKHAGTSLWAVTSRNPYPQAWCSRPPYLALIFPPDHFSPSDRVSPART